MSGFAPPDERAQPGVDAAITSIFGGRSLLAERYAELLTTVGIERGVIGPREASRIWVRHLLNSAVLADLIATDARVIDLGAGAGLPGIPIAIARPDVTMVLLEPMQRRVAFLAECLAALDLPNVSVRHGRAEDGVAVLADIVVARAVAPLAKLMRLSFELLVDDGVLLALKGRSAVDEMDQVRRETAVEAELVTLPAPGHPATVVRLVRPRRTPTRSSGTRKAAR